MRKIIMTCIVGVEVEGKVVLAGDVLGSNGFNKNNYSQPKVFKHNNMIFGYTSTFRFGQVIQHHLDDLYPPETTDISECFKWGVKVFVPKVNKVLKETETEKGTMLFGFNGLLWTLQNDSSILHSQSGFASVGSGMYHAAGALDAYQRLGKMNTLNEAIDSLKQTIDIVGSNCTTVSKESVVMVL